MFRDVIHNARRGKRFDMRPLLRGTDFDDDVKQARALLSEERWLFEEFQVLDIKKEERWGLVPAYPARLKILEERGYHTQFDSTHKDLTSTVWESFIDVFDELGMAVYETIERVAIEDGEQEASRDNGRVEAILDLRVIEEHLRQLTYVVLSLWRRINWLATSRKRFPDPG